MTKIILIKEIITDIREIAKLREYMFDNSCKIVSKDNRSYDINDEIPLNLMAEESLNMVAKPPSPKKIADDIIYKNPHLTEEQKNIIRQKLPGDKKEDLRATNVLDLHDFGIKELPKSIGDLWNLALLDLADNQLESLPKEIEGLESLRILMLQGNKLNSVPAAIEKLMNLRVLDLSRNELKILPEEIEGLESLETLALSDNQLEILPEKIEKLMNLRVLDLSHNKLNIVPEAIRYIWNLERLLLGYNELQNVPEDIIRHGSLKELDLTGNPLTDTDIEPRIYRDLGLAILKGSLPRPKPDVAKARAINTSDKGCCTVL